MRHSLILLCAGTALLAACNREPAATPAPATATPPPAAARCQPRAAAAAGAATARARTIDRYGRRGT